MKRLATLCIAGILFSVWASSPLADPKGSTRKLQQSYMEFMQHKKAGLPPCPLADADIQELAAWTQQEYEKQGIELSLLQATIMAGLTGGYATAKQEFTDDAPAAEARESKKKDASSMLPEYDMAAYCKGVSMRDGGGSVTVISACMDLEEEARTALKAMKKVSPQTIQYCIGVANVSGKSYAILHDCVKGEKKPK